MDALLAAKQRELHIPGLAFAIVKDGEVNFDGNRGGQETTFGQDEIFDEAAKTRARREYALPPLLDLRSLYHEVRIVSRQLLDGQDAYVLELAPDAGEPIRLWVAVDSALVLRRESPGEVRSYADYRLVDGERVPFRTTIEDALGTTVIEVSDVKYGVTLRDPAFGLAAR